MERDKTIFAVLNLICFTGYIILMGTGYGIFVYMAALKGRIIEFVILAIFVFLSIISSRYFLLNWYKVKIMIDNLCTAGLIIGVITSFTYLLIYYVIANSSWGKSEDLMNPQLLFTPWVIMAVYFLIPIVGQLCIVREKYLRMRDYKRASEIQIKSLDGSVHTVKGEFIVDYVVHGTASVISYKEDYSAETYYKESVDNSFVKCEMEIISWDKINDWAELKSPLTEKLFKKYLKLKYKFIWIIKRSKRRERREQYDIALKTKELLRVEDVIPPVILAGSLLYLFLEGSATQRQISSGLI